MQGQDGSEPVLPILPDPATHIRLLTVLGCSGAAGNTSIQISLISVSFSDAPAYHAVSYTWGSPAYEEEITIHNDSNKNPASRDDCALNESEAWHSELIGELQRTTISKDDGGKRVAVRKNCADVLRQLFHFKPARYYWIDALCIDQKNDVEKSFQVAMMGEIFSQAECVLSCVGTHQNDSKFMADTLRECDTYLALHEKSTAVFSAQDREWTDEKGWTLWYAEQWLSRVTDDNTLRLYKALDAFTSRSYFWRIWILQELFLAQRIVIFCGLDEISLPTLLFWWVDAKAQWFFQRREDIAAGKEPPILYRKLTASQAGTDYLDEAPWNQVGNFLDDGGSGFGEAFEDMLRARALGLNERRERQRLSLEQILTMCEDRNCQDPRDTVYGTLSLADWEASTTFTLDGVPIHPAGNEGGVRPDYSKSRYNLAKQVLTNLQETKDLVKLVIYMLDIGPDDEEVISGIEARRQQPAPTGPILDTDLINLVNQSEQDHLQLVEGGFQLKLESGWTIEPAPASNHVYIRPPDRSEQFCAVASATTQINDWFVPTLFCYGFVLRQTSPSSRFYTIVGKVWVPPDLVSDDLEMTAFMLWLGVDDALVHLGGGLASIYNLDSADRPGEKALDLLNDSVCGQPYSSCAEIPGERRIWTAKGFALYSAANTFQLLADWHGAMAEKKKEKRMEEA